jgi:hypothetical protein
MMWRFKVEVIKRDGNEKWPLEDLARVFLQNNAFTVDCGDGSFGLLEPDAVGRIIAENPNIV